MHLRIANDRLIVNGSPCAFKQSPHHGGRMEPTLIVGHDTADRLKPDDSINWFQNPRSKVSAHLVLARDATFTQLVDFDVSAYHAGKSTWRGRPNCNGYGIGIEIDNPGPLKRTGDAGVAWYGEAFNIKQYGLVEIETKAHGRALWMPYTDEQIFAFQQAVLALAEFYPSITDVAGHFEISPGRKVDVGPHFPLSDMRRLLAGRQPANPKVVVGAQQRLALLGYFPGAADGIIGVKTRAAIRTFQEQNRLAINGHLDKDTLTALLADAPKAMPTAAREATTKADLKAQGSSTMSSASKTKRAAETLTFIELVSAVGNAEVAPAAAPATSSSAEPGAIDALGKIVTDGENARSIADRLAELVGWLATPHGLKTFVTLAVCAVVWKFADKIEFARLRDHILGKNTGATT